MSEFRALFKVIGIFFAIPMIASLVQHVFHIPIGGVSAMILTQYIEWRDSIFSILALIAKKSGEIFTITPTYVRDLLSLYMLGFTAWMFTSRTTLAADVYWYRDDPIGMEASIRKSATDNSVDPDKKWLQVLLGFKSVKFKWLRHIWASMRWPIVAYRNLKQAFFSDSAQSKNNGLKHSKKFLLFTLWAVGSALFLLFIGFLQNLYSGPFNPAG